MPPYAVRYLFTGEQFVDELGQYYLRARYMDPRTGRMMGLDPWVSNTFLPISLNKYIYSAAQPVRYTDPSGEAFGLAGMGSSLSIYSTLSLTTVTFSGGFLAGDYFFNEGIYHVYENDTVICNFATSYSDPCSLPNVFEGLLRFPAPFLTGNRTVQDGDEQELAIFGRIKHSVSTGQVINTTLKGHLLYPGYVKRELKVKNNSIFINTFGEGAGRMQLINSWLSDPLWSGVDWQIRNYVTGSYF